MQNLEANKVALLLIALVSQCAALKPHILLIVVDDLGWSDVGYHNISAMKTPNIDRLATEGVILENYYVQPVCTPTRSALLTGRYPIHTGYSTHIVGKWHLGFYKWDYTPTYRGFDTFYGFYLGAVDHWTYERFDVPDLHDQTTPVTEKMNDYSANIFAERAKEVIEAHNTSKPMFLYLPFLNVHSPVQAPARFVDMYKDIKNAARRGYGGMVSAMDEAVGNVTDALKSKGMWNNTLVIFTTDNGGVPIYGGYNWPLRGGKGNLWEGGVRGAAFVHGDMLQTKRRRCRELLHVTDWYPTILGLAGRPTVSDDRPLDGMNVWDTISKGAPSPREEILLNIDPPDQQIIASHNGIIPSGDGMALRSGDMKILMNVLDFPWYKPPELGGRYDWKTNLWNRSLSDFKRVKVALYNITADPEERNDLSAKYPDVVARLRKRLEYYRKGAVASIKKLRDPMSLETAKKNGYWGPWRTSNRSNFIVIDCLLFTMSVLFVFSFMS